jgi:AcrR family transcriptional regulator
MPEPAVDTTLPVWERRKREATSRIQAVALDLFDEHGYRDVTVERVAAAAGVSPSSIYRYFGTKEMLVLYDEHSPQSLDVLATVGGGAVAAPAELAALVRSLAPLLLAGWLTPESESRIRRRMRYVRAFPDIRDGLTRQTRDLEIRAGDLLAERLGRDRADLSVRLAAAAIIWGDAAIVDHWIDTGCDRPLRQVYAERLEQLITLAETLVGP